MSLASALHSHVPDARRVDAYYAPVARAIASRVATSPRPFVVGIQGPQGCGKSTLAAALVDAFGSRDERGDEARRALSVSIDDFYLTRTEQLALAQRHPGDRTLEHRGYPGTHDVELGRRTLASIVARREGDVRVPAYDKSAHHGRGDRAPSSTFRRVELPVDLVIVEGWMLGFAAASPADTPEALRASNAYLEAYVDWPAKLGMLLHLDVAPLEQIVEWRVDSERARREKGEPALGDAEARDYIERFLPAYGFYVPRLRARPPCADFLRVRLGADRMPESPPR